MIAHLEGVLAERTPTRIIIDVRGVGYELLIPITTSKKLGKVGGQVKLWTYLHVREDALQLFGFATTKEKLMFLNLISVSGVGPKLALSILSGCEVDALKRLVVNEELGLLTKLPGVGRKTAQRLVVDLKEKISEETIKGREVAGGGVDEHGDAKFEEAILALVSLGHNRNSAERVLAPIVRKEPGLALDEVIRRALQSI